RAPAATERQHTQRRRGHELEPFVRLDHRLRGERLVDGSIDGRPKRIETERLDGQPALYGPARAGELQTTVREVDAGLMVAFTQVFRVEFEGPLQQRALADHQT